MRAICHSFRHSLAIHLFDNGYVIRMVQDLLGHGCVKATTIYTHWLRRSGRAVEGPLYHLERSARKKMLAGRGEAD